jgi:WD40 repeat protein
VACSHPTGEAEHWHRAQNHVATGGYDKIVRLFDVESGSVLKTFTGHSLSISSVMFNPLGNLIVSGSKDSNVRFWDSVSGLCIRTLNAQLGEVTSVDMNDVYLLTSSRDNAIRLWDVRMVSTTLERRSSTISPLLTLSCFRSSAPSGGSSRTPTRRRTSCARRSRTRPCW